MNWYVFKVAEVETQERVERGLKEAKHAGQRPATPGFAARFARWFGRGRAPEPAVDTNQVLCSNETVR